MTYASTARRARSVTFTDVLAPAARTALIVATAAAGCDRVFEIEDVGVADVRTFDAERDCPPSYEAMSPQTSRYRVADVAQAAWSHNVACESDAPGLSHLAVIDTQGERVALLAALDTRGSYRWYVGAVQRASSGTPEAGWLWLTGSSFDPNLWAEFEPDDADGIENGSEQFAMLQDGYTGLADCIGNNSQQALCECDGRPVTDEGRMALDAATAM